MYIFVLVAYEQMSSIKPHANAFNNAKGLNVILGLYIHILSMYANIDGSGESAHMRRLIKPSLIAYAISAKIS